jgi:hypothetical protein
MVYHNARGQGFISFSPNGSKDEEFAKFQMRELFLDGALVPQKVYHSWPLGKRMNVAFNAMRLLTPLRARERMVNVDDGTEQVFNFVAGYSCCVVWSGEKPTEEAIKNITQTGFKDMDDDLRDRVKVRHRLAMYL